MTTNTFFRKITLFLICISGLIGCSGSEKNQPSDQATQRPPEKIYKWKMVTTWPKNLPGLGLAAENFSILASKMSGGRLQIKVYGAGQLVPALETFDAVSQGTAEMGHGSAYYWKGKTQTAALFTTVPFGLNAQEMNSWLHYGGGMELWRELYEPFNLVPLAAGNTGVQMAGWFNREIKNLGDLKGLKMRIPGIGGEVISRLGVETVNIPGGELYTAMQTGVIDATEWVGPYNDLALGFHQVAKYYYYPGMHEPGSLLACGVNKSWFTSLSKSDQALIKTCCAWADELTMAEYNAKNGAALKRLVNDHGVKLEKFNDKVYDAFAAGAAEVYDEVQQHSDLAKRTHAAFVKGRKEIGAWTNLSDSPYIQQRNRALGL